MDKMAAFSSTLARAYSTLGYSPNSSAAPPSSSPHNTSNTPHNTSNTSSPSGSGTPQRDRDRALWYGDALATSTEETKYWKSRCLEMMAEKKAQQEEADKLKAGKRKPKSKEENVRQARCREALQLALLNGSIPPLHFAGPEESRRVG